MEPNEIKLKKINNYILTNHQYYKERIKQLTSDCEKYDKLSNQYLHIQSLIFGYERIIMEYELIGLMAGMDTSSFKTI